MKNYSRKTNRRVTRYNSPSTFIVRRAEKSKRNPFNTPPARGKNNRRFGRKRNTSQP